MNELDGLLDELDRDWSSGSIPDLTQLLARAPGLDGGSLVEVCAADLEWRWRTEASSAGTANQRSGDGAIPPKPVAADYRHLLSAHWKEWELRKEILEAEFCARSIWGGEVDVDQFVAQIGAAAEWSEHLSERLHDCIPLDATLAGKNGQNQVVLRVGADFVIGRQRTGEPDAPAWMPSTRRLIVAGTTVRSLSREQFRVRRTSTFQIEVTNLSRSELRFESEILKPGDAIRMRLPFWLTVGDIELTLDGCSDELV